jgi:hypothetical protein
MHAGRWLKEASQRLVEADQDCIALPVQIGKAIVGPFYYRAVRTQFRVEGADVSSGEPCSLLIIMGADSESSFNMVRN